MTFANQVRRSLFVRTIALASVVGALVAVSGGCEHPTREGQRCNPLVAHDECASGLSCRPFDCQFAYCCPPAGMSNLQHCNPAAPGCPDQTDMDSGMPDEAGDEGAETGPMDAAADAADAAADG
jgi:hypothetical protein